MSKSLTASREYAMFNPPNLDRSSGFDDLAQRITERLQQNKVDDQIVGLLQQGYETELTLANIILSRTERTRLFVRVATAILLNAQGKIDSEV